MLLVVPVPFRIRDGVVHMEEQASNGLRCWADNFEHVTIAAPTIPESMVGSMGSTIVWTDVSQLAADGSVTLVPLPWAYDLVSFLKTYRKTRRILAEHIDRAQYLQFAIGALVGDWAGVAANIAIRKERRFAVHADRVEYEVVRKVAARSGLPRRIKALIVSTLMRRYHRNLIQRCTLGLWHGSDCYHAFSPWCETSFTIHDVHTKPGDCIDPATLHTKLLDVQSAQTINICYAGRLDVMKAPLEWLKAISVARDLNTAVRAVWFGDGPLYNQMVDEIRRLKLEGIVELPGFVSDRSRLLVALRSAHMTLFTHVTPESPRCLLESLISGTPIVGYDNKFAEELTESLGGGSFVPIHDWEALGQMVAGFAANRDDLVQLINGAAQNGRRFSDVQVFAERSNLIARFC